MPRAGKEKKNYKYPVIDRPSTSGFRYPNINFPSFPRNNDVFAYKVEELIPGVLICDDIFSQAECQMLVRSCQEFLEPTNKNNAPPKKGEAFRNNDRYLHPNQADNIEFADKLWRYRLGPILLSHRNKHLLELHELSSLHPSRQPKATDEMTGLLPSGVNADLKFYRYKEGAQFGRHVDEPVFKVVEGEMLVSEFTILMYISCDSSLKGGETKFWLKKDPVSVEPKCGRICLHWTGKECLHSGEKVERGEKYVLRTDLFYKRVL